jgi:hypothetical protein
MGADRSPTERLGRVVQRMPGGKLVLWAPRAVSFTRQARRAKPDGDGSEIPRAPNGMPFLAGAMLDELMLAVLGTGRRQPSSDQLAAITAEIAEARAVFAAEGWLDDPVTFHHRPPAPRDAHVRPITVNGVPLERLAFDSDFRPDERIPGVDRWRSHERNRTARAWVVRSADLEPRPWIVHLHSYGMGKPGDTRTFRAEGYRDRGVNVIQPVFPLHGPRRSGRRSGEGAMSLDAMSSLLVVSQAIWDVRRCIAWARSQGATAVGVHGFSLGAYTAALLAGIEDDLACVIAGVPPVDIVTMVTRNAPPRTRAAVRTAGLVGDDAQQVYRVVSPLAMTPKVPRERRFIYAAIGDRIATAEHAAKLWQHWDQPQIHWLGSGHVRAMHMGEVHRFVRRSVYSSLLGDPEPPRLGAEVRG